MSVLVSDAPPVHGAEGAPAQAFLQGVVHVGLSGLTTVRHEAHRAQARPASIHAGALGFSGQHVVCLGGGAHGWARHVASVAHRPPSQRQCRASLQREGTGRQCPGITQPRVQGWWRPAVAAQQARRRRRSPPTEPHCRHECCTPTPLLLLPGTLLPGTPAAGPAPRTPVAPASLHKRRLPKCPCPPSSVARSTGRWVTTRVTTAVGWMCRIRVKCGTGLSA